VTRFNPKTHPSEAAHAVLDASEKAVQLHENRMSILPEGVLEQGLAESQQWSHSSKVHLIPGMTQSTMLESEADPEMDQGGFWQPVGVPRSVAMIFRGSKIAKWRGSYRLHSPERHEKNESSNAATAPDSSKGNLDRESLPGGTQRERVEILDMGRVFRTMAELQGELKDAEVLKRDQVAKTAAMAWQAAE